ncbi:MAG: serine acetyltransferase [Bacteroidales bacterium]|nr:serine acetyltransferase [Bacteroidales bacterium]
MPDILIPDKKAVEKTIKSFFRLLFPATHSYSAPEIENILNDSKSQMVGILTGLTNNKEKVSNQFFKNLENIKNILNKDAVFILESDPAAKQLIEVIAIYPGFFAIFCYRIANSLARLSVPLLPRMITEYAHKVTGIDIHPLAEIGSPFSIDHGTGIVIGETAVIGNNVKLYQGVTLGALSVDKSKASKKRHPTIEDNVILYASCTILGGETVVGRNSIIGGNVWLTESIAPFSLVYHKSEIIVRNQNGFQEPINFII